jgi:hypothetical protein
MRVVLLLGLIAACESKTSSTPSPSPPVATESRVWDRFFADIRAKHWREAHDEMVGLYRDHDSVEDLQRAIEANPLAVTHTSLETAFYGSCSGMDQGLCAGGGLNTPIGKVTFEVRYVIEGNADRIVTMTIAGAPLVGVGIPKVPQAQSSEK